MKYIEETGVVKTFEDGKTIIRLDRKTKEECAGCCACSAFSGGLPEIRVPQSGFKEGERVRVSIPRANPYLSILFVFFLPLVLFMVGLFLGQHIQGEPRLGAAAVAGGIAGLAVALIAGWLANRLLLPEEEPRAERIDDGGA